MMIAWKTLRRKLSAFGADQRGNIALTFVVLALPVIAFVGAAVDYSRANSVKAAMQTALDSTALMLSKEASTDTQTQLKDNALKYFTKLFDPPGTSGAKADTSAIQVNVTYSTSDSSQIIIDATAQLPAQFIKILGYDTFTVKATSTAKWGITRLRVALVLDNTGSMADAGKIGALQVATKGLLTQLQGAVTVDGDVYVSIIPFVKDVNVGSSYWNADWVYWGTSSVDSNVNNPADPIQDSAGSDNVSWNATNGVCTDAGGTAHNSQNTRSKCFANVGTCSNNNYTTQSTCTGNGTCSVGGTTSQNTCNSSGTCSISGNNSQNSCTSAGTCSISGHNTQNSCNSAGTCSISGQTTQNNCQSAGVCSKSQYTSKNNCKNNGGTWTTGVWTSTPGTWTAGVWTPATFTAFVWTHGTWTAKNHKTTWNGCVMDRGYPASPSNLGGQSGPDATYNFDTNAVSPDPVTPRWSSLYPAEQYSSCPQAVMGLSYNWSGMTGLVNAMSPNGNTNQAIGLQLGWMSLVGGGPFIVPALDQAFQYTQVIILLTDGLNTQDRWYSDQNSIDARQQLTCDNIKAQHIQIYTIQVNTGGDPTSALLQNCATDPSMFFLLTSAGQMTATFGTIGTNLTKLRVAN
jgi:Flp pilus assembly protein TadG